MKFRANYLLIPAVTILVALIGSQYSMSGMEWYDTELIRPAITPPKWVFPIAWNLIFLFTTISALIFWNKESGEKKFLWFTFKRHFDGYDWVIALLFILNAILNVLWSYLFFTLNFIDIALIEMVFLNLTNLLLIILLWSVSRWASLLLLPYFLWVSFATYLTYQIWFLN